MTRGVIVIVHLLVVYNTTATTQLLFCRNAAFSSEHPRIKSLSNAASIVFIACKNVHYVVISIVSFMMRSLRGADSLFMVTFWQT